MGGSDYGSLNDQIPLIPPQQYEPIMRDAMVRLPALDSQPHDLVQMLFSKEEQEWLKQNLRDTSH